MPRFVLPAQLILAYPRKGGGYTWTYPSLLGQMLGMAEALFGERDASYTILGVEFTNDDRPKVWYASGTRNLIVQLTARCIHEPERGCYQLAHECVHLIAPNGAGNGVTVLEEGLATWFAAYFMRERIKAPRWGSTVASYQRAERLVRRLLDLDRYAIKALRSDEPRISSMTSGLLLARYPELGTEAAAALCAPFVRDREIKAADDNDEPEA